MRSIPFWTFVIFLLGSLAGCAYVPQPLTIIEPSYSYVKDKSSLDYPGVAAHASAAR